MKYLKLFEEFFIPKYNVELYKNSTTYNFQFYNLIIYVEFENMGKKVYLRDYYTLDEDFEKCYDEINKNAFQLINIITYITKEFINEYNPECIIIPHLNTENEINLKMGVMNIRAKLNKRFLSKIPNYVLDYYSNTHDNKFSSSTVCYLHKPNFDISVFIDRKLNDKKILEDYNIPYTKLDTNMGVKYRFEIEDILLNVKFEHYKFFTKIKYYNRSYNIVDDEKHPYALINKNPYAILETVTKITEDFIKEYNPDVILIQHLTKNNEKLGWGKLNQRAKANYKYLKNIEGYKLNYFEKDGDTYCYLSKINFDLSNILMNINNQIIP